MRRIVEAAIIAAKPDGLIRCYFRVQKWEGNLKELFLNMPEELAAGHLHDNEAILKKMKELSDLYGTSRKKPQLQLTLDAVREEVSSGDWATPPPKLLVSTEDELKRIAAVVRRVINHVRTRKLDGQNNSYSFTTKFLHYIYPETFAIYDSRVWQSIKSVEAVTKPHVKRRPSKDWYSDILLFYREFWQAAEQAGLTQAMSEAVQNLEAALRLWSGKERARITLVDAIDKFLYLSNGHPKELGLKDW